jgi:hypothetical protein
MLKNNNLKYDISNLGHIKILTHFKNCPLYFGCQRKDVIRIIRNINLLIFFRNKWYVPYTKTCIHLFVLGRA